MTVKERRRYLRYETLDVSTVHLADAWVSAVIIDVGLGGLQMRTRSPLPTGFSCDVFVGRQAGSPITLRCELRHCQKVTDSELYSVGVRFVPSSHADRLAIAEYVHGVFQRQCQAESSD
jgi:hypothetical protein